MKRKRIITECIIAVLGVAMFFGIILLSDRQEEDFSDLEMVNYTLKEKSSDDGTQVSITNNTKHDVRFGRIVVESSDGKMGREFKFEGTVPAGETRTLQALYSTGDEYKYGSKKYTEIEPYAMTYYIQEGGDTYRIIHDKDEEGRIVYCCTKKLNMWPKTDALSACPKPDGLKFRVVGNEKTYGRAIIYCVQEDGCENYVKQLEEAGFVRSDRSLIGDMEFTRIIRKGTKNNVTSARVSFMPEGFSLDVTEYEFE